MSMNPGATINPRASTTRRAGPEWCGVMAAIRPSRTARSARTGSDPVPSRDHAAADDQFVHVRVGAPKRGGVYHPLTVVVSGPEDLAPDQLTERLRGVLPVGRVTAVHAGERPPTIVSTVVPLRVEYSADAPS